jgi:hypothetical protein
LMKSMLAAAVFAGGGGCAMLETSPPEEQVRERAEAFVTALRGGEREEAFSYTTPAYQSTSTPARLLSRYGGVATWTAAAVDDVVCDAVRCEVTLQITYRMVRPRIENTRPLQQIWVESGGQWYLYPNS